MDPRVNGIEVIKVIDAFVDGERVDAGALKQALSEPTGRDYLVDAWLLREGVQDQMAAEPAAPSSSLPVRPHDRPVASRRRQFMLASAAAVIFLAGGYAIGARFPQFLAPARAPVPVEVATPVSVTPFVSPSPTPRETTAFPVPAPTRVIRMELGAESKFESGG